MVKTLAVPIDFIVNHQFEIYCTKNPPLNCSIKNNKLVYIKSGKDKHIPETREEVYRILHELHTSSTKHLKRDEISKKFNKLYFIEYLDDSINSLISLCSNADCIQYSLKNNITQSNALVPITRQLIVEKSPNKQTSTKQSPKKNKINQNLAFQNYDQSCRTTKEVYTQQDLFKLIGSGPHYNLYYKYIASLSSSKPSYPYVIRLDEESVVSLLFDERNQFNKTKELIMNFRLNQESVDFYLYKGTLDFKEYQKEKNKYFCVLSSKFYEEIYYYFNATHCFEVSPHTKHIFKNEDGTINELVFIPLFYDNHFSLLAVYVSKNENGKLQIDCCVHCDPQKNSTHRYQEVNRHMHLCLLDCCTVISYERNCYFKKNINWEIIKKYLAIQIKFENGEDIEFVSVDSLLYENLISIIGLNFKEPSVSCCTISNNDCGSKLIRNYYIFITSLLQSSSQISQKSLLKNNFNVLSQKYTLTPVEYVNLLRAIEISVSHYALISNVINKELCIAGLLLDLKISQSIGFPENVEFELCIKKDATPTSKEKTYSFYLSSNGFIFSYNSDFEYNSGNFKKIKIKVDNDPFSGNALYYFDRSKNTLYYSNLQNYEMKQVTPNTNFDIRNGYHGVFYVNSKHPHPKQPEIFKSIYERLTSSIQTNKSLKSIQLFTSMLQPEPKNEKDGYLMYIDEESDSHHFEYKNNCFTNQSYELNKDQWQYVEKTIKNKYQKKEKQPQNSNLNNNIFNSNNNNNMNMNMDMNNNSSSSSNGSNSKRPRLESTPVIIAQNVDLNKKIEEINNNNLTLINENKNLLQKYNDQFNENSLLQNRLAQLEKEYLIIKTANTGVDNSLVENLRSQYTNEINNKCQELEKLNESYNKLLISFNESCQQNSYLNSILHSNNITANISKENLNYLTSLNLIKAVAESINHCFQNTPGIVLDSSLNSSFTSFINDLSYLSSSAEALKLKTIQKLNEVKDEMNIKDLDFLNQYFSINITKSPKLFGNEHMLPSPMSIASSDPFLSPVMSNNQTLVNSSYTHLLLSITVNDLKLYVTTIELATYFPQLYDKINEKSQNNNIIFKSMLDTSDTTIKYYKPLIEKIKKNAQEFTEIDMPYYPLLKDEEIKQFENSKNNNEIIYLLKKALRRAKFFKIVFEEILNNKTPLTIEKAKCCLCNEIIIGDNIYYKCEKINCPNIVCHQCINIHKDDCDTIFKATFRCVPCINKSLNGKECAVCEDDKDLIKCSKEAKPECMLKLCSSCLQKCPNSGHSFKTQ